MATFTGTSGNDTIRPGLISDGVVVDPRGAMPSALPESWAYLIVGDAGDDVLEGGGNDEIYGGSGDDTVFLGGVFASTFGFDGGCSVPPSRINGTPSRRLDCSGWTAAPGGQGR